MANIPVFQTGAVGSIPTYSSKGSVVYPSKATENFDFLDILGYNIFRKWIDTPAWRKSYRGGL